MAKLIDSFRSSANALKATNLWMVQAVLHKYDADLQETATHVTVILIVWGFVQVETLEKHLHGLYYVFTIRTN
jgi:hypothetical protein